jgi:hypothetical protein
MVAVGNWATAGIASNINTAIETMLKHKSFRNDPMWPPRTKSPNVPQPSQAAQLRKLSKTHTFAKPKPQVLELRTSFHFFCKTNPEIHPLVRGD